jgi:hypothetical protein
MGRGGMDYIDLAEDRFYWRATVDLVMKLLSHTSWEIF